MDRPDILKADADLDVGPCGPIQLDLSAMLDGELDAPSIRRVLVHADVCPSCQSFLRGIRNQAKAHRQLADAGLVGDTSNAKRSKATEQLRQRLLENQRQLARILYELGRGFVLMTVSENYSQVVAREPVPPPDMCMRGRHLLDEVQRFSASSDVNIGDEWVRARVLFDNRNPSSKGESLARGKRMLREALMLKDDYHEARVYLGQAYQVEGDLEHAKQCYQEVLRLAEDPVMRAYALENLGNVYLQEGRHRLAIPLFEQLVESGAIETEPRFYTTYFNLALSTGLVGQLDECSRWLDRLYQDFPHKRRLVGEELRRRQHLMDALQANSVTMSKLTEKFPEWFVTPRGGLSQDPEVLG